MQITEAVWDDIQKLPNLIVEISRGNPDAEAFIYSIYKKVYGIQLIKDCSKCHIKAYHQLTSLTLINLEQTMSEKLFKLKEDVLLDPENDGNHVSSANLTDELAEQILGKYPNLAKHFEVLPEGFVAGEYDGQPAVNIRKLNKENLLAVYAEVFGAEATDDVKAQTKPEIADLVDAEAERKASAGE